MFNGVSSGEKTSIQGWHSLKVFYDLRALFGDAVNRCACFTAGRLTNDGENQAFDLP